MFTKIVLLCLMVVFVHANDGVYSNCRMNESVIECTHAGRVSTFAFKDDRRGNTHHYAYCLYEDDATLECFHPTISEVFSIT